MSAAEAAHAAEMVHAGLSVALFAAGLLLLLLSGWRGPRL